jgi:hypothetical protein
MDYDLFEEALVDYFARQHHDPAVARSRAETVVRIARGCDDEAEKKPLVIDFTAPENMGGGWLQPLRDEAEKLRRARLKAARKATK